MTNYYLLASDKRELVRGTSLGSGRIGQRITEEPRGLFHAYELGDEETLCGLRLSVLYVPPGRVFDVTSLYLQCELCRDAVAVGSRDGA